MSSPGRPKAPREPIGSAGSSRLPPFESVVAQHGPAILRFCSARVGATRAEDCLQETMLAALRAYEQVRDPEAIRTWLFSIAARKAIDLHRVQARLPEPTDRPGPGAVLVDEPDDDLWAQVRALPDKQRQAVTLRYRGDLTHAEIARVMGTSEPAARRNLFEGLKRLRKDFKP